MRQGRFVSSGSSARRRTSFSEGRRGSPAGHGTVTAIDPGSTDPGWNLDDEADGTPIDAVWQTTRNVRIANGYKSKITITIAYETVNDADKVVVSTCRTEVGPGEVVDLFEGDWQVNARQIHFTARADDGKEWKRFSKHWLPLVAERDKQSVLGYASPRIETSVIAIK